ncbi:MAG: ABC transporter ATP-binding protein [Clostridiales bacterium]|nr:ABC transporter ATP-binding protein [Clostridiales bacterium]
MEDTVGKEVLRVDDVGMRFNLMEKKVDNLKEYFIKLLKNEIRYQEFWALKNISFKVNEGDRLGILGLNGAGKSTLLKIIAGVLKASEGELSIRGKIVPLLELGAGFDAQYTGVENIYLYGAVLGYPKEFINEKFNEIVEFSELGDFINVPVKNYSSGMKARLGFSIATIMDPEILILDEVLSVGDAKFRKKSEKRILDMFDKGVTVLFVSHSIEQVRRICSRAIILDKGKLMADGPVEEICNLYEEKYIGTEKAVKPKKKKKKKKKLLATEATTEKPAVTPDTVVEASKELVTDAVVEVSKELVPDASIIADQEIVRKEDLLEDANKEV